MAGAEGYVPENASVDELRAAVPDCRGCDLYKDATQAVFGEGPADATVHPSSVLRSDDREAAYQGLVADLNRRLRRAVLSGPQRQTRR